LTSLQTMRRFSPLRPWLLGLFLLAQLAGVVPVMFDHAVHLFESQPAVSSAHDHSAFDARFRLFDREHAPFGLTSPIGGSRMR
jgi:hypothetical protein